MQPAGASEGRREAVEALLDAAERLLVEQGYGAITTRKLAEQAGVNPGLVHYYFGSMEEVMVQVLERFTARLIERQRAMYSSDRPFLEKWRAAWAFQEEDLSSGYSKIWLELQAMAWNRPELRARVQQVNEEWRRVLTEAFAPALREYGFDALSLEADREPRHDHGAGVRARAAFRHRRGPRGPALGDRGLDEVSDERAKGSRAKKERS